MLAGVAVSAIEPGSVDKAGGPGRLAGLGARAAIACDHGGQSLLDHDQQRDHLANPLAGEILKIAGLIDADHVVLHIFCQT
ncbi:MAG: hypothetical protein WBW27_18075, partial [Pseudolabrys sp.]